jgi:hypothetical protein
MFYVKDLTTKAVLISGWSNDGQYVLSESSRLSLRPTGHKTIAPLDLIFSHIWGPAPIFSFDGFHYFVIFIDVHMKYIW